MPAKLYSNNLGEDTAYWIKYY